MTYGYTDYVENQKLSKHEALRQLMNKCKVDGLTRALTRQPQNPICVLISLGCMGFYSCSYVFVGFPIETGISY